VSSLSIVPHEWLYKWLSCDEASEEDDSVRINYSKVLLRCSDSASRNNEWRLDPFAIWSNHAVLIPSPVLHSLLGSGRTVTVVPRGLALEDMVVHNLLKRDAAEAIRSLMQDTRKLVQIIAKIRDGEYHHEPWQGNTLVRQTMMTWLNTYYGGLHDKMKGKRRAAFNPSSWELLSMLIKQRKSHFPLPRAPEVGDESLSAKSCFTKIEEARLQRVDLTEGLRCRHGRLIDRFHTLEAEAQDLKRLQKLSASISDAWRTIGYHDTISIECPHKLFPNAPICQVCKDEAKLEQQAKRRRTAEEKQGAAAFGELSSATLSALSGQSSGAMGQGATGTKSANASSSSTAPRRKSREAEHWNCLHCTFLNSPYLETCEMCNNPKGTTPV